MTPSEQGTWSDANITAPSRSEESLPSLAPGTELAGRYVVEGLLGEGGMGEVYLARHKTIDKPVAIKMLAPERARRPKTVSRFLQEAKAASKIRHEHIVDITDFGESDGHVFFVMEFLDGEDLSVRLKREGRLSWDSARSIAIQILDGLGAAHSAGVVHRDVKPHNCFIIARESNREFVKIIDFGIAKVRDGGSEEQLTQTGAIMGTADYMSPEQGQGMELDGRSDLYSVGVILYRMLTGRVPFRAGNSMATVYMHVNSDPELPSQACPDAALGSDVDALVLKALAKSPQDRFASASEFIAALEGIDDAAAGGRRGASGARIGLVAGGFGLLAAIGLWLSSLSFSADAGPAGTGVQNAGAELAMLQPGATPASEPELEPESRPEPEPQSASETKSGPDPTPEPEPTLESATGKPPSEPPPTTLTVPDNAARKVLSVPKRRSTRNLDVALSKLKSKVSACGKKAGLFPGEKVDVTLSIATHGRATRVNVIGSHASAGESCIVKAIKRARFGPAQRSQSVKHRFTI